MKKPKTEISPEEYKEILQDHHNEQKDLAHDIATYQIYGEEGSPEENILKYMAVRNRVRETLLGTSDAPLKPSESKSLTVRVGFKDYAKLKVLSGVLRQSPSGLAKNLLLDGISESISACAEIKGAEWAGVDFMDEVNELSIDLHIEAQENAQ